MADLIERKAAIRAIEDMQDCYNGFSDTYDKTQIISVLEEVPTAERKGHWIEEDDGIIHGRCSNCGWVAVWQSTDVFGMDYCPHCGVKMEG